MIYCKKCGESIKDCDVDGSGLCIDCSDEAFCPQCCAPIEECQCPENNDDNNPAEDR
jgi:hypothetical protein